MCEVNGKVVLVTGAAAGIGAGIVKAFLDGGAKHVAALDVDASLGKAFEKELIEQYACTRVKFHKCDVTTDELIAAYDDVINHFGYIDVVVNCAGIMNDAPSVYLKEIEINVSALIKSSLKAYELMRKDHGGRGGTIINISSIVGLMNVPCLPIYAATKSAVLQFSTSLGMEPNRSRSEVRVLTICFGCTETSLLNPRKLGGFDKETDKVLEAAIAGMPLQKPESAVCGLMHAFQHGDSATVWLVTSGRPAEDITENVKKAYQTMSQGVLS